MCIDGFRVTATMIAKAERAANKCLECRDVACIGWKFESKVTVDGIMMAIEFGMCHNYGNGKAANVIVDGTVYLNDYRTFKVTATPSVGRLTIDKCKDAWVYDYDCTVEELIRKINARLYMCNLMSDCGGYEDIRRQVKEMTDSVRRIVEKRFGLKLVSVHDKTTTSIMLCIQDEYGIVR